MMRYLILFVSLFILFVFQETVLILSLKINRVSKTIARCFWRVAPGGGGVAHKDFFDSDARPNTNFNYPKNIEWP